MNESPVRYIFIACPWTLGDREANMRHCIEAADFVTDAGFIPFVPLLYHFWHQQSEHPEEFWCHLNLEWLKRCDALLRLKGKSVGADEEVRAAMSVGLPIFHGLSAF